MKELIKYEALRNTKKLKGINDYLFVKQFRKDNYEIEYVLKAARVTAWIQEKHNLEDDKSAEMFFRMIDVFTTDDSKYEDSLAEEIAREMEII